MSLVDLAKRFQNRIEKENLPVIGSIVRDKENILYEHMFKEVDNRNIFSHSKSFTSILIGYAVMEGYLTLDTRLVDVFSDMLDGSEDERLKEIKLRHLLSMSSGFNQQHLMGIVFDPTCAYPDYLKYMLKQKVEKTPGSTFCYSNGDTYLALRMMERCVGVSAQVYLYEKIFKPLDMGNPIVQTDFQGRIFGASGYVLSLQNQAKIAKILLDLPQNDYFLQMKSRQVDTLCDELSDHYGFQFWISSKYNVYRADGMWGQVTVVFEKEGQVISYQCLDNTDQAYILKVFEDEVLLPRHKKQ